MKKLLFLFLAFIFVFSCKKEVQGVPSILDATLKILIIKRSSGNIKTISPVSFKCNYELEEDVSKTNNLIIEVTPSDENASVYFDRGTENKRSEIYEKYKDLILITVKNGTSSNTYKINIKRYIDVSLQSLTIKQEETKIQTFAPVDLVNTVKLPNVVDGINYLTIEVKAKDSSTNIYFDDESIERTQKVYTNSQAQIKIKTQSGKNSKEYILVIQEPENKTRMKRLLINQKDVVLKELISYIPKVINVELKESVSSTEFVMFEVTTEKNSAQVFFDDVLVPSKIKKYENFQNIVKIKIKEGNHETEYKVNLKEPTLPEPKDYSCKCNVVDSAGGSNVDGAIVKVYEEGSSTVLQEKTTNIEGNVYFSLEGNKYYTFVVSKKGSAGSRVDEVYIPNDKRLFLPIVIRDGEKGALAIAPRIDALTIKHNGNEKPFEKHERIDFSKIDEETTINVTVKSYKIIPERKIDNRRFGISLNIGAPYTASSYGNISLTPNIKETNIDLNGEITQKFSMPLNKLVASNGENTLYFVIYDVAGNRCEHHKKVIFENANLNKNEENLIDKFSEFSVYSERYYRSLGIFGMPKEENEKTSARVILFFKFEKDIEIGKVDVFRRPYQEKDMTENWELVCTKSYEKGFVGQYFRDFKIADDLNQLKEGEMYQYKLEAYNANGKIISPIATVRIMEAFNVLLTTPKNNSEIYLQDIKNQNFAFEISNPKLWENADYFSFAFTLQDEKSNPIFISKMRYYLNGEKDLKIADKNKVYKKYSEYTSINNIDELIKYDNGLVTITKEFFNEPRFSIIEKKLVSNITQGGLYYWDIQDIDVYQDDVSAYFVKEYPYLDNKTGKPLKEGKTRSYSFSNLDGVGGAINGKALFIVK